MHNLDVTATYVQERAMLSSDSHPPNLFSDMPHISCANFPPPARYSSSTRYTDIDEKNVTRETASL